MEEQIHLFLDFLQKSRGYAPNTIQAYRNDLAQLLSFAQIEKSYLTHWVRVDRLVLISFLSHLAAHDYTPASISRKTAVVKTFFQFLLSRKLIFDDPSLALPAPRVEKKPPQVLSPDEIERLLICPARQRSPKGLRDCAILELVYASGMRVTEIVSLDESDLNLSQATVSCRKERADCREIPITQRAVEALANYLQRGRLEFQPAANEKALFVNSHGERLTRQGLWLIIKKCVKQAEIKTAVTPQTLRHSFAVHLLNRGENVAHVQHLLGHSNVATTLAYVRFMEQGSVPQNGNEYRPGVETAQIYKE